MLTESSMSFDGGRRSAPAWVKVLVLAAALVAFLVWPSPAGAVTIISQSANTDVILGLPFTQLEFENPLAGSETVQGYQVLEWRDADYAAGPPRWYDDWTVPGVGIDGNPNEIWLRTKGHWASTSTTVASTIVSIHLTGDSNDGVAQILVDGNEVARLDMNTAQCCETALVIVRDLADAGHTVRVNDLGPGAAAGQDDIAIIGAAALRKALSNTKWNQPPQPANPGMVYLGWNEKSVIGSPQIVADDFICASPAPITRIQWWGSHLGWKRGEPAPDLPMAFQITIWTDVQPLPGGLPFSHPGQVIWEYLAPAPPPQPEGWDFDPRTRQFEANFSYQVVLEPGRYFYQEPGVNQLYWLSIAAVYPPDIQPRYPWGWKTRRRDPQSPAPDVAVVIARPTDPHPGMVYEDGARLGSPSPEDGWDMAFALLSEPVMPNLKWQQPPVFSEVSPFPQCYWGWNEPSTYQMGPIVADDWFCADPRPVTDIHWWGSYVGWTVPEPPPPEMAPMAFHFGIWTDVPAGMMQPYSHPGVLIWEFIAPREMALERMDGCDFHPRWPMPDTCFRYDLDLPPELWFYQDAGPNGAIFWLSISAIYPAGLPGMMHPWGWKTRPRDMSSPAPDDAVRIFVPSEPHPGMMFLEGMPIEEPPGQSWDTAFELTTVGGPSEPIVKWYQPPIPYAVENAFNGWNEPSVAGSPQIVADDWVCTTEQPVTDIHWWGSFLGWDSTEPPMMPSAFQITIWTDVPPGPTSFSHPGVAVWQIICTDFTWEFVGWDFDPRRPYAAPEACFRFDQILKREEWFWQEPGTHIYWVSIAAVYPDVEVEHPFGWKTVPRLDGQSPDDAVRLYNPTSPELGMAYESGEPIFWPTPEQSWDMAFRLTTQLVEKPQNDLGDAPDSSNSAGAVMTAYPAGGPPGVVAKYPTVYAAGSPPFGPVHAAPLAYAYLGKAVSLEKEADVGPDQDPTNNILPPLDAPDKDRADDGVNVPLTLPHCAPTTFQYTVTTTQMVDMPLFVNVWFDWNRDGDWDDLLQCPDMPAPEWAVQNQPVSPSGPGVEVFTTPPFVPWHPPTGDEMRPIWMRITLSERPWQPGVSGLPGEGGSGPTEGYRFGETEDYYFTPLMPELDYGDAPDPAYPTRLASNGARHLPGPFILGQLIDVEPDGQPDPTATGDDLAALADEDGVTLSPLKQGQPAVATVFVTSPVIVGLFVTGWIDFNGDGSWATAGDQILVAAPVNPGPNIIAFNVPATATPGISTFARFRLHTNANGVPFVGYLPYGEVEDYLVRIEEPDPSADLGDAPDSSNIFNLAMTAYPAGGPPGVQANYPTVYKAGSPPFGPLHQKPGDVAWLGLTVTLERDADAGPDQDPSNNIVPQNDLPDKDLGDDGVLFPLALPHCTWTRFNYVVTLAGLQQTPQLYVNVWFDWNRDGDWDDVLDCRQSNPAIEWAVQNQALRGLNPGQNVVTTPAFLPWHPGPATDPQPIWMRVKLSEKPWQPSPLPVVGYGGSGPPEGYEWGETEDYYFTPQTPPENALEFSLDIGSDKELSDPNADGDEGFDPGDVYFSRSSPVTPPVVPGGRDGEKDDRRIFGLFDPRPDPPDASRPPASRVPVGSECNPAVCYHEYFDLDGHDQIDLPVQEIVPHDRPLGEPWLMERLPRWPQCIWPFGNLALSFDDDQASGWPVKDVPVVVPSAAGATYGRSGPRDEIMTAAANSLGLGGVYVLGPLQGIADEISVHRDLCHNPDAAEDEDDDVDSIDVTPGPEDLGMAACPFWYYTADHEADMGLDPGAVYLSGPLGPGLAIKILDPTIHLGLAKGVDLRDFEFTWLPAPGSMRPALAIAFAVAPDDPLTQGTDESGGLNPSMIYGSFMTGRSFPLLNKPLPDRVDGLALWAGEVQPPIDVVPPVLIAAASRRAHGTVGSFDIPLPIGPASAAGVECRRAGPTEVVLTFSEPLVAADGIPDGTEVKLSHGVLNGVALDCNEMIVTLGKVPDKSCLVITLSGLVDLGGNALAGDNDLHIVVLMGDANGDGLTASADITQVKARSGQTTDATNFRWDITADGIIASADITVVKSVSGNSASCP